MEDIIKQLAEYFGKKLDKINNNLSNAKFNVDNINFELKGIDVITLKGNKGEPGESPTDEHLVKLITPLIPEPINGKDGITPTKEELKQIIIPLIPEPIKGDTGEDSIVPGPKGDPGKPGKDGSPDTGEEIVDKVNKDKSGKVIKKEHVEGLKDIEDLAKTAEVNSRFGMRAAGDTVYCSDLTSQCNGVTKTFTIPVFRRAISLIGTQFPLIYRPTTDWTAAGTTLTLTSAVGAPETGQTLLFTYII